MFKSLSYKFANILVRNEVIEDEDFEIYRYGFETLVYFIINISVALLIGIALNKFIQTIIFLVCYCTLRQFTGGYHARNYTECTITFALIYISIILVTKNIDIYKFKYILILLLLLSTVIIHKVAPLEHRNKPLSIYEKKNYRNIIKKITLSISIVFTISLIINIMSEYIIYSSLAVFLITILLLVQIIINFFKK
ncbi:accessory gene regulator B family protein [Clostridioides difficile]|uniref:accessory gene regulator ArgB-like protein n=1 Tax=Clostridioides difficile TaxID=1496 RepID=UPI0029C22373|nr:accessory gene regulator B family protein [Clostridioides difficile]MDX5644880.1 accessory gene regulator B family protein [Clostridioides difficile]